MNIFKFYGIKGLYKGLEVKLYQTVLSTALMYFCFEKLKIVQMLEKIRFRKKIQFSAFFLSNRDNRHILQLFLYFTMLYSELCNYNVQNPYNSINFIFYFLYNRKAGYYFSLNLMLH